MRLHRLPSGVTLLGIKAARELLAGVVHKTPLHFSHTFSRMTGSEVYLKCENLQRSGSFKLRGAYVKIAKLTVKEKRKGVVAASAGNHAQGVALAAARAGIRATVVMPRHAPITKVMATKGYGARVILWGETYDDAKARALHLHRKTGATYIPAFDDYDVIAGQGTVGLEILEELPDCDALVVPIGGGGLVSGVALGAKESRPEIKVYGVQAKGAASLPLSLEKGRLVSLDRVETIADGIAVKKPGQLTFPLIQRYVDGIATVDDDEIASTILLLLERSKLLVEGAGAVGLAALLNGKLSLSGKKVVVVLSGGNIDIPLLSRILEKGLAKAGRYLRLEVPLQDRPGALKEFLAVVARAEANVISVEHDRLDPRMPINRVEVYLTVETRDTSHGEELLEALREKGYEVRIGPGG